MLVAVAVGIFLYVRANRDAVSAGDALSLETLRAQPSLGESNAPVKLAVFEDFKCPACLNFEENVFPQLKRDFVDTGEVEVFFFNYPFIGPDSTTAAVAGECAYNQNAAAFWDYKTTIYRSQGPERETWATPARLVELARDYVPALDAGALETCLNENRYAEAVASDLATGERLGVNSTPSVFVDGTKLSAPSYGALSDAINAALAEAGS